MTKGLLRVVKIDRDLSDDRQHPRRELVGCTTLLLTWKELDFD